MEADFPKLMEELPKVIELTKKLALLLELLPPIEVKPLRIKDTEYIAILIQRKKMCV